LTAIEAHLARAGLWESLPRLDVRPATRGEIEAVHTSEHVDLIRAASERTGYLDPDTHVGARSHEAALLAAGALLSAADVVMGGGERRGLCLVRPPGHHATVTRAMGFCLFNNVAVCARYLKAAHGVRRVAIVDFDVHHGNGTEDAVREDPDIFFLSLHRFPFYPGTGGPGSKPPGTVAVRNFPLSGSVTREEYFAAFEEGLREVEEFAPEVVLVSAGFDAHVADPIGGLCLEAEDYGALTERIVALAERTAGGRVISTLEGGYGLRALGPSVEAHLRAL
jgi:acetoin utilization deacetylase AcuC-like enzyme